MLTSSVNATAHHSWKRSSSRWNWRSRGQCSPRLRCRTRTLSPCSWDSRCRPPFSSGSSKSGIVVPGSRFVLMAVSLSESGTGLHRADAGDAEADAVDARQRGHVEAAGVGVAPGEVVGVLGQADEAELLAFGREHPDAARPADVEVAG